MVDEEMENMDSREFGIIEKVEKPKFVGRFNISEEYEHMEAAPFDNLNYVERIKQCYDVINALDTPVRNEMEEIKTREKTLNNRLSKPDMQKFKGVNDILWQKLEERGETVAKYNKVVSYMNHQIRFLTLLVSKMKSLLDSFRGASEEHIISKTQREQMNEIFQEMKKMREDDRTANRELMSEFRDHDKDIIEAIMMFAGVKDGKKLELFTKKRKKDIEDIDVSIEESSKTSDREKIMEETKKSLSIGPMKKDELVERIKNSTKIKESKIEDILSSFDTEGIIEEKTGEMMVLKNA